LPWAATSGIHFVEAVINADNYRAKAGGLAMKKSPSADVRDFGRALWVDSIEDTRNLQWVLNQLCPPPFLPTTVTPQYMFVIDKLLPVTGDEFDRRFIAQQVAALSQALALAQAYARYGDDFELKEYAKRRAPKIEARLAQIRQIQMRYQTAAR
jgi:putative membrane protein